MILSGPDLRAFATQRHIYRADGVEPVIDLVSIGLHLGERFLKYKGRPDKVDLPSELETDEIDCATSGVVDFPPGCCLLASTIEIVKMPLDLMGFIQTKGTIARGFVTVHLCDGQIDPGFEGNITLELVNLSSQAYVLRPGVPIAQLFLHKLSVSIPVGYRGRYQMASGPTSMRI